MELARLRLRAVEVRDLLDGGTPIPRRRRVRLEALLVAIAARSAALRGDMEELRAIWADPPVLRPGSVAAPRTEAQRLEERRIRAWIRDHDEARLALREERLARRRERKRERERNHRPDA